jgi:hypothetical protein
MSVLKVDSGGSVALTRLADVDSSSVLNLILNAGTLGTVLGSGLSMSGFGAGAIVSSSSAYSLTLSNTDPATPDYTGTTPSARKGDYYASSGGALTAGTASSGSMTATTASAIATDASGGTAPYTYQWYRSTTSGTLGSAVVGQTTRSLSDSGLSPSTSYYYTLRYTDAASATVNSNQVAETTPANVTTYLDEHFGTGSAGASITGHSASPTGNGSDTWGDLTSLGFGAMGYVSGGGAAALGFGTQGAAFSSYPLTGVPENQVATFVFNAANSTTKASVQLHRDSGGNNVIAITADYPAQTIDLAQVVGGTATGLGNFAAPLTAGASHTMVVTIAGASLSITMDGTTIVTGQAIPAGTGTILLIGQGAGTPGDAVFTRVKVTSN